MTSPVWLLDAVGALMLATAAYCAGRLVVSRLWRRRSDRDIDAVHALMGVAMAGMLVPGLAALPTSTWTVVFGTATAWFAARTGLALRQSPAGAPGGPVPHGPGQFGTHGSHLVLVGAMLYMFLALRPGAGGMGDAVAGGAVRFPLVALLLCLFLVGYAVHLLDRAFTTEGSVPGFLAPRTARCCDLEMSMVMVYALLALL